MAKSEQRTVHQPQLAQDDLHCDGAGNILKRQMFGGKPYLHALADHEHQHLRCVELRLQIVSMACELELVRLHVMLVYGCGDQHINLMPPVRSATAPPALRGTTDLLPESICQAQHAPHHRGS